MMSHVVEHAASGRAKCRGCGAAIAKGELRFGERAENIFGEGEMTLWFHLPCAAYKRPQPFLEFLQHADRNGADQDETNAALALEGAAAFGAAHPRVPRVDGAERAPTGRARCRHCRELIEKDSWRIPLVFFEEYRFQPSGFIHAACADGYFGTTELLDRILHFSPGLDEEDLAGIGAAIASG